MAHIGDSIRAVRERIEGACSRVGRSPDEVRLIGVTKKVDLGQIREAASLGLQDFGENYIQEAREKIDLFHEGIRWHMIGHLQRNKVKYVPGRFSYVHSVDCWETATELDRHEREIQVLFELNLSGETTKHGLAEDDLRRLLERVDTLRFVRPVGLMTMAPYTESPEEARPIFSKLRHLLGRINREFSLSMTELSMGMSSDFEAAIEEGATMVRVGTAIFGERVYAA